MYSNVESVYEYIHTIPFVSACSNMNTVD